MSLKESNEITVKITCPLEELYRILEGKGFKIIDKFTMDDKFMILKTTNLKEENSREILSKAILIRDIIGYMEKRKTKKITFKNKQFDSQENILSQNSINCDITNIEDAIRIFQAIGYYQVMEIIEDDIVYEKDGFQLAIKDIKNGAKLIEVETDEIYDTIDKLKMKLKESQIPIDESDYFVKKAELELDKVKSRL